MKDFFSTIIGEIYSLLQQSIDSLLVSFGSFVLFHLEVLFSVLFGSLVPCFICNSMQEWKFDLDSRQNDPGWVR